jgi:hypothetical protein
MDRASPRAVQHLDRPKKPVAGPKSASARREPSFDAAPPTIRPAPQISPSCPRGLGRLAAGCYPYVSGCLPKKAYRQGQVAQVVEQWTENPRVVGATPTLSTLLNQSPAVTYYCGAFCSRRPSSGNLGRTLRQSQETKKQRVFLAPTWKRESQEEEGRHEATFLM